jgi:hypothetical protein
LIGPSLPGTFPTMNPFLEIVADQPTCELAEDVLLELLEGEVEVLRDGIRLAKTAETGAVSLEMSMLLGGLYTTSVRTLRASRFASIPNPRGFLGSSPVASLHVARVAG